MNTESFDLVTEYSSWYIFLCLLAGAGYALFLYVKERNFSGTLRIPLGILRFLVVSFLCYLLLTPFLKTFSNLIDKPIFALIVDDSESLMLPDGKSADSILESVKEIKARLSQQGFDVRIIAGEEEEVEADSIDFDAKTTNIASMIESVEENFQNRNLVGAALISDGITNQGLNPLFLHSFFPVYTLGVGDTLSKNDLWIDKVKMNKTAYLNNKFPVEVSIGNQGFQGKNAKLSLYYDNNLREQVAINFSKQKGLKNHTFLLDADTSGKHKVQLKLEKFEGESNTVNNDKISFIDVVNAKQSVLICATAPHPDIRALKRILKGKEIFEEETVILSFGEEPERKKYDLVIFHNVGVKSRSRYTFLNNLMKGNGLYFYGLNADLGYVNQLTGLKLRRISSDFDEVQLAFSKDNGLVLLEDDQVVGLENLPPLKVPFFDIESSDKVRTVLTQQIGSVRSDKPVFFMQNISDRKVGVFIGEGFWKLGNLAYLNELNTGEKDGFRMLFQKSIQYLSARMDKRKLVIEPVSDQYQSNENIYLDIHVYNELYEEVYDKKITLNIGEKSISFIPSKGNTRVNIGKFEQGVYDFTGKVEVNGENLFYNGQFVVKENNIEALNTTANFHLLRNISDKSKGSFYVLGNHEAMINSLIDKNYKDKIISTFEEYTELINKKWLFLLIMGLISLEWAVRKYNGFI